MIGASYFFYGWWNPRYIPLLAGVTAISQLSAIAVQRQSSERAPPVGDGHRRRPDARAAAVLQVLRVLHDQRDEYGRGPRPALQPAAHAGTAADRRVVLHVHGDQLRRGCLSPRLRGRVLVRRDALSVVLPSPRRRADRAARRADPADRRPPRRAAHRRRRRGMAHPRRPVQEGRHRELPRDRDRRPGLRRPVTARMARDRRRHRRLRGPDLLRLLRLHRHRDRRGEAARVPVPAELRPAVLGPRRSRRSGAAGT